MRDELLDTTIGGWQILLKIGQGATGSVYEARRERLRAAIKVIRPDVVSPESVARFRREAKLLMEINHPHVVRCLGAGETDGFVWLALEFCQGGSLDRQLKRRGRISVPEAVGVANVVLEGLDAVHERGILHRDIKPGNFLLTRQGTVKLADFNLARSEAIQHDVTTTGTILGTPFYMAPEQVEGKDVGQTVDLYAMGAVIFHMLTGRPPFEGSSPLQILQKHMNADVPDPSAEVEDIPSELVDAIKKLMAKVPGERPATAAEAKALLDGLPSEPLKLVRPRRRRRGKARRPPPPKPKERGSSSRNFHMERTHALDPEEGGKLREAIEGEELQRTPRDLDAIPAPEPPAPEPPLEVPEDTTSRAPGEPAPLPRIKRSKLLDLVVILLVVLAGLYVHDARGREAGGDPLMDLQRDLATSELGSQGGWRAQVHKLGISTLEGMRVIRPAADQAAPILLALVGFLVLDRILAGVLRVGVLGRVYLNIKALTLRRGGELHAAARVYELMGDRVRAGQLLESHGMPLLAAEFYAAAGLKDLEGQALLVGGKKKQALKAFQESDSTHEALAVARSGEASRETAQKLADQGLVEEAAIAHFKATRYFEAADLYEQANCLVDAVRALEAGFNGGRFQEYWQHTSKQGTVEEAEVRLARRIAELYLDQEEWRWAAVWYEKVDDFEEATDLYEELGDDRSRARCLLRRVPAKGKLTPPQQELVSSAAEAYTQLQDPQAIDLWVRLGRFERAAELSRDIGDYPQAAQFFARANRQADGAVCAERAGNRQLAAFLYDEGGEHERAAQLYRELGQLSEAAEAARKAANHEMQAELLEKVGDPLGAAKACKELGQDEKALELAAKVSRNSDSYVEARLIVAEVHHKAGRHQEAADAYLDGLYDEVSLLEEVGPNVRYSISLEAIGDPIGALKVLDRFKGKSFAPRDLKKRRADLKAKIGSQPSGRRTRPVRPRRPQRPKGPGHREPAELVGQQLDAYTLEQQLGESSFAWVFRARSPEREVALKVLKPSLAVGRAPDAFVGGASTLIGLENPHVLTVYDGGSANGLYYVACEFVRGPNLEKVIATEAPLKVPRAANLGVGILSGVASAHERGVLHLDLTPSKVLVAPGSVAKVMDFGMALVLEDIGGDPASFLDARYVSPEQTRGEEPGEASDQYVAGLVIYKMLTGKLPYQSKNAQGFWEQHGTRAPLDIQEYAPHVPHELADAIMRSLSRRPRDRHPSISVFAKELESFVHRGRATAT